MNIRICTARVGTILTAGALLLLSVGRAAAQPLPPPDPRDRPYAGILYGTIGLDRRTWDTLDRFEFWHLEEQAAQAIRERQIKWPEQPPKEAKA